MSERPKLPPGWTWTCTYAGDGGTPPLGKLKGADGTTIVDDVESDLAEACAWSTLGIPRKTYEAMERAVEFVRDYLAETPVASADAECRAILAALEEDVLPSDMTWNLDAIGPIECPNCSGKRCDEDGCCASCGADMFYDEDGNPLANLARQAAHELHGQADALRSENAELRQERDDAIRGRLVEAVREAIEEGNLFQRLRARAEAAEAREAELLASLEKCFRFFEDHAHDEVAEWLHEQYGFTYLYDEDWRALAGEKGGA